MAPRASPTDLGLDPREPHVEDPVTLILPTSQLHPERSASTTPGTAIADRSANTGQIMHPNRSAFCNKHAAYVQ